MKKRSILGMVMLALLVLALPLSAQTTPTALSPTRTETIADITASNDQLSTFVSALEAADLTQTLSGDGEFTLFAPTDAAFEALPESTRDTLMGDSEALGKVLNYHVMDGVYTAEELLALGGFPAITGAALTFTEIEGVRYVNNARIVTADLQASNGIVHIIDTVLVPPAEAAEPEIAEPTAYVRAAHFVADAGAIDVYFQHDQDIFTLTDLNFAEVSDFSAVPAAAYTVTVTAAGGTMDEPLVGPFEVELDENSAETIAATGTAAHNSISAHVIDESASDRPEDQAHITVFHGIENAPAVNVQLADGTILAQALAYPDTTEGSDGTSAFEVPPGVYDLLVTSTADDSQALFALPGTSVEAGKSYLVALIGVANSPSAQVMFYPSDWSTLAMNEGNVIETAAADGRFSTLLVALDEAGLTSTLQDEGPFTVFAPTNDAFAALPEGAVDNLLQDPASLTRILDYHVVEGVYTVQDLIDQQDANGMVTLTTVEGEPLPIRVEVGELDVALFIDNTQLVVTDIPASNGVIHGIDTVLIPAAVDMEAITTTIQTTQSAASTQPVKTNATPAAQG